MAKQRIRAYFRLFQMPCCGQCLCWVNPRLPNYCPECGKFVFTDLKFKKEFTQESFENSWIVCDNYKD